MNGGSEATFFRMASEFPIRTGVFTVVPFLFAALQLANSYLHGGSLVFTAGFAVAVVAYAIVVNSYHLTAFRLAECSPIAVRRR